MKIVDYTIKKYDPTSASGRQDINTFSGFVGIGCNVLLCITKWTIGFITNSLSVQVDAFNNLSDATSNIITIIGAQLAKKPVDEDHPFGHGRMEYVTSFVMAIIITVIGFELAQQSVMKILNPEPIVFEIIPIVILCLSILVKVWMAYFNHQLYQHTQSLNLKVVVQDSLNDCLCSSVTIVSVIICHLTKWYVLDGIVGLIVALIILKSAVGMIIDILKPLLGQAPDPKMVKEIEAILNEEKEILGIHELMIHDYGPGRTIASVHVEVSSKHTLTEIHHIIDDREKKILKELGVIITIHMDPIEEFNEVYQDYFTSITEILSQISPDYQFHDLHVDGEHDEEVSFDVTVPFKDTRKPDEIKQIICDQLKVKYPETHWEIDIEHSYI